MRAAPPEGGVSDPHMTESQHVQGELAIGVATLTPPDTGLPATEVAEPCTESASMEVVAVLPSIADFAPDDAQSLVEVAVEEHQPAASGARAAIDQPPASPVEPSAASEAEPFEASKETAGVQESSETSAQSAAEPEPLEVPAETASEGDVPSASPTSPGFTTLELELPPPAPPSAEERLYIAARDATHRGDLAEARRAYAQLLELAPQHIRARNNLALLLAETGNIEGALAAFQRAIELDSENPTLLANRAAVLSLAHRYAAAEADLKKAMRIAPDHVESLVQYAVVRSRRGRWREALDPLRRAVLLDPTHATGWYHLGEAANQTEQLPEAVAAFRQAILLAPSMWRAQKGLGNVLDRMGRVEEAAVAHRAARAVQAAGRRA